MRKICVLSFLLACACVAWGVAMPGSEARPSPTGNSMRSMAADSASGTRHKAMSSKMGSKKMGNKEHAGKKNAAGAADSTKTR